MCRSLALQLYVPVVVSSSLIHTPSQVPGSSNISCDGNANGNAGCGVTEWSRASYGPIFDEQGGGVFAMKWDDQGIAVCAPVHLPRSGITTAHPRVRLGSFYRAAVPADVLEGSPNPSTWGEPVAMLDPSGCDPIANFVNHSIVFGAHTPTALSSPYGRLIGDDSFFLDITFCGEAEKRVEEDPADITDLISFPAYPCHR